MIEVRISKNGTVTHKAIFPTQAACEEWYDVIKTTMAFGKPAGSYLLSSLTAEELASEISRITEQYGVQLMEPIVTIPNQYQVEYVDVTAQELMQKKLNERRLKRAFGEQMIDEISLINESKGLLSSQVDAFMSTPLIAGLRENLWSGNITTFIDVLTASDVSAFFTAQEKAAVIAKCQAFLQSLED
jgi:hypothetical protein